jgi:hypothetical protein
LDLQFEFCPAHFCLLISESDYGRTNCATTTTRFTNEAAFFQGIPHWPRLMVASARKITRSGDGFVDVARSSTGRD